MISLKQFDTARPILDLLRLDGTPIDLTGASVFLLWKRIGRTDEATVTRVATITNPSTSGAVSYQPVTSDVAVAGDYELEWLVRFAPDNRLTVPTQNRIVLKIYPALA